MDENWIQIRQFETELSSTFTMDFFKLPVGVNICLCWPPLTPFKAAQIIQVDNLLKPLDTMKIELQPSVV
jgi:hypothetical protein